MKPLLASTAVAIALAVVLLGAAACGGTQNAPADTAAETGDADKAGGDTGQPAGKGLGMARDATVLAEDGSHVQLQSAWLDTHAVVIFLRGHW